MVDKDPNVVVAKLQDDANRMVDWLLSNKLCLAEGHTFPLAANKEKKRVKEIVRKSKGEPDVIRKEIEKSFGFTYID